MKRTCRQSDRVGLNDQTRISIYYAFHVIGRYSWAPEPIYNNITEKNSELRGKHESYNIGTTYKRYNGIYFISNLPSVFRLLPGALYVYFKLEYLIRPFLR